MQVESAAELRALLEARRFSGSNTRTNIAKGAETWTHPGGRVLLKEKVLSDVTRKGKIFDIVKAQHPWVEQLTLNKNTMCTRHTDRNEGNSVIAFFGDFENGGLFIEEPDGLRHVQEKNVWHEYNGRHPHYTEAWTGGERYSIVAYKKKAQSSASSITNET